MSKPVKSMILEMYRKNLGSLDQAMLVDLRGITANENNALRMGLARKQIRVTVLKNNLARKVFGDTALKPLSDMLEGPSALVHGGDGVVTVVREMLDWARKIDKIQPKGAVLEGTVFTADQIKVLSQYPTKPEAQSQVIGTILGGAGSLIAAFVGVGNQLAGIVEQIEKKLEKGEAIAKVA